MKPRAKGQRIVTEISLELNSGPYSLTAGTRIERANGESVALSDVAQLIATGDAAWLVCYDDWVDSEDEAEDWKEKKPAEPCRKWIRTDDIVEFTEVLGDEV